MNSVLRKLQAVVRVPWRAARMLIHVLRGMWIVAFRFPQLHYWEQHALVQTWAKELLAKAGVQVQVQGQPPAEGPVLLVANHISWLDIPVMHAARHCRFISKSDIKGWPLIGTMATAAGTLYIQRESRRDAMRMVSLMREAFARGEILAVFPEGTTGDGTTLLPFHPNLLQAAVEVDAPVLPVGLRFIHAATGTISQAASYVGDETLLGSIWRVLCANDLVAVVHYGQPERAAGRDRRAWSKDLQQRVDELRQT